MHQIQNELQTWRINDICDIIAFCCFGQGTYINAYLNRQIIDEYLNKINPSLHLYYLLLFCENILIDW